MFHYAQSARANTPGSGSGPASPLDHLRNAYNGVLKEDIVLAGGATACGVSLDSQGVLQGVK